MKTSNRKSLPKRVNDMSKGELEEALKKKKECNAKALQIVENTLENPVNVDWFVDNLKYIRQSHFDDIVEERAIVKMCGYPLCSGMLKNVPVHQYHISAKLNKVYDTTERKKYCSNQCYRAGKYLKDQLLTSPLWFSGYEDIPHFKLLPIDSVGMVGEEVDLGRGSHKNWIESSEEEIEFTSINQIASESLNKGLLETVTESSSNTSSKQTGIEEETMKESFERLTLATDSAPVSGTSPPQGTSWSDSKESTVSSIELKNNMLTFLQQQVKTTHSSEDVTMKESFERLTLATESVPVSGINPPQGTSRPDSKESTFSLIELINMPPFLQQQVKTTHSSEDTPLCTKQDVNNTITNTGIENTKNSSMLLVRNTNTCVNVPEDKKAKLTKDINVITKCVSVAVSHKPNNLRIVSGVSKNLGMLTPSVHKTDITNSMGVVLHVETCLREWFNLETLIFLYGEKKTKEMIVEKGKSIKEYYKVVSNASWDPKLQERYESICKRLNLMELEDNHFDQTVTTTISELKPLPDYRVIQEEGLKLEMKVNAFYQGKVTYVEDTSLVPTTSKDSELMPDPLLPLVDTHAQKCYRRKIVQDRLSKVLPDLLRTYGVASRDVNNEFRALVRTFSLEAHNIFFKPAEWNLIGLIIINMLAIKNLTLKAMLDSEQAKNYRTLMLIPYQQDSDYIEKVMSWLTNIDNLVDSPKPTE